MTVSPRSQASRRGARSRARRAALDPNRLTKRQTQLLVFILKFWTEHGHSPTIAQMLAAMGYSSHGSLIRLLNVLEWRGHIVRGVVPTAQMRLLSLSRETPDAVPRSRLALRDLFGGEEARAP